MALIQRAHIPADTSGSTAIVVVAWLFPVLATLAVAARVLSRKLKKSALHLEDWLVIAALVLELHLLFEGEDNVPNTCLDSGMGTYCHYLSL